MSGMRESFKSEVSLRYMLPYRDPSIVTFHIVSLPRRLRDRKQAIGSRSVEVLETTREQAINTAVNWPMHKVTAFEIQSHQLRL